MSTAKSLKLKKGKSRSINLPPQNNKKYCIIHYARNKSDNHLREISEHALSKIHECLKVRQSSNDPQHRLDNICDKVPRSTIQGQHGIHRWCYQNVKCITAKKCQCTDEGSRD